MEENNQAEEVPDVVLLRQYCRGDTLALAVLVKRHSGALYRFAREMSGQHADAEDVVQEVWRRVVRKADGFRGESFRGWLFRICRNHMIDRSRVRKASVSLDEPVGDGERTRVDLLPAKGPAPGQAVANAEWRERLAEAVEDLSDEQREVFLLRAEGMAFKDIAGVQKVSINTALARMHYAVKKLRKVLSKDFGEEGSH